MSRDTDSNQIKFRTNSEIIHEYLLTTQAQLSQSPTHLGTVMRYTGQTDKDQMDMIPEPRKQSSRPQRKHESEDISEFARLCCMESFFKKAFHRPR